MAESFSEKELIQKFKEVKDPELLSKLFVPYMPLIYGVALKYFKQVQDAEDCVNKVYELIAKRLPKHDVENFRPWLYVLTKNYCLEVLRSRNNKLPKENDAALMYSEQVFHPDDIRDDEKLRKLKECIKHLSKEQRDCIENFYYKSLSYKSIARLLNIKWNTVRSHIQNGRRMLKNCIENK